MTPKIPQKNTEQPLQEPPTSPQKDRNSEPSDALIQDLDVFETRANVSMNLLRSQVESWIPKEYTEGSSGKKDSSGVNGTTDPILYKSQKSSLTMNKAQHHQLRSKILGNIPRKEEGSSTSLKRDDAGEEESKVSLSSSTPHKGSSSSSRKRPGNILDMYLNKSNKKKR